MEDGSFARRTRAYSTTFIGGILGLVTFLVAGLLPSLLYGGYGGVILGGAIFGMPIHESVFAQATVIIGVISSVLSVGGIFVLSGAIVMTGIHGLLAMNRPGGFEGAGAP